MHTQLKILLLLLLFPIVSFAQSGRSSTYYDFDSSGSTPPSGFRYGKIRVWSKNGADGTKGLFKTFGNGQTFRIDSSTSSFNLSVAGGSGVTDSARLVAGWGIKSPLGQLGHADSITVDSSQVVSKAFFNNNKFTAVLSGNAPLQDSVRFSLGNGISGSQSGHNITYSFDSTDFAPWRYYGSNNTVGLRDTAALLSIGSNHTFAGTQWSSTRDLYMYTGASVTPIIYFYNTNASRVQIGNNAGQLLFTSLGTGHSAYFTMQTGIGASPVSELDVAGGVGIGSYAGVTAAPTNGLIMSGAAGIGVSAPRNSATSNLEIWNAVSSTPLFQLRSGSSSTVGAAATTLYPEVKYIPAQVQTANATQTTLFTISVSDTTVYDFDIHVSGKKVPISSGGHAYSVYHFRVMLDNTAGTPTIDYVDSTNHFNTASSNYNVSVSISSTNLIVSVIGGAHSMTWEGSMWQYRGNQ